jgi:phage-related protein
LTPSNSRFDKAYFNRRTIWNIFACFDVLLEVRWQICQRSRMRTISWVRAAFKEFNTFPQAVQEHIKFALEVAAAGQMADTAKPMKGLDSGIYEIALPHRGDAYRTVYAVKLGNDLWVLHAFQKKSTQGIKTPQREIEIIRERLKRLKETEL